MLKQLHKLKMVELRNSMSGKNTLKVICLFSLISSNVFGHSKVSDAEKELSQLFEEIKVLRGAVDDEIKSKLGYFYDQGNEEVLKHVADVFGVSHAQYLLAGLYYKNGQTEQCKHYAKLAADRGHLKAQGFVASLYSEEKNDELAYYYFKLAADQGDSYAQGFIGVKHLKRQELDIAEEYLLKSMRNSNADPRIYPRIYVELGALYLLKEKYQIAEEYLKKANSKELDALFFLEKATSLRKLTEEMDEISNKVLKEYVCSTALVGLAILYSAFLYRCLM